MLHYGIGSCGGVLGGHWLVWGGGGGEGGWGVERVVRDQSCVPRSLIITLLVVTLVAVQLCRRLMVVVQILV